MISQGNEHMQEGDQEEIEGLDGPLPIQELEVSSFILYHSL